MRESKYILIILFLHQAIISGQDYRISFTNGGQGVAISQVIVDNLTQETSLTINGNDVLHLLSVATGVENVIETDQELIKFWPNPANARAQMDFYLQEASDVQIIFFNSEGKVIHRREDYLSPGKHSYTIEGHGRGMNYVRIIHKGGSIGGSFIGSAATRGSLRAMYIGAAVPEKGAMMMTRGARADVEMQYNEGDRLMFTGIAGNNRTVITDVPTSHKSILFAFHPCTDENGNHYPVVQINGQIWMAENLKATKYRDSTAIPYVAGNQAWAVLDHTNSAGYCWYGNDSTQYRDLYGGLYNAWAVNTGKLCPAGWHIPSSDEWLELCLSLDPESIIGVVSETAGGKLKETGTLHWEAPNANATNETGFSALPGGHRFIDGSFSGVNKFGVWSSDNGYSFHSMDSQSGAIDFSEGRTENGHSVRCIKDK